jgi:hypothetical protein
LIHNSTFKSYDDDHFFFLNHNHNICKELENYLINKQV